MRYFRSLTALAAALLLAGCGNWAALLPGTPAGDKNFWTLVGGFQSDDGSRWGRPVAAVAGPDGAVYITDDGADAIYRLAPPG